MARISREWRPRRRTQVIAVVVIAALAATGVYFVTRPATAATTRTVDYTVSTGSIQQTVDATGTLAPAQEADLNFAVSGTVTQVLVTPGQAVTSGQALATVDTTSLQAAYSASQAQVTAAQAAYTSDSAASATSAQLSADSAQIQSAKAAEAQAATNLNAATLRATMSGTVTALNLAVGQSVTGSGNGSASSSSRAASSSSSSSSSTTQVVVATPHSFIVTAAVNGTDIASVQPGMEVKLTPSGASQAIFGTVTTVGSVATAASSSGSGSNSSTAATFPVTVTVTGDQPTLFAGTSVAVSIVVKQLNNVLTVPTLALTNANGQTTVQKLVGGKPVSTPVTVGQTFGATTQITAGLSDGDQIQMSLNLNRAPTRTGTGTGSNNRGGLTGGGGLGGGGGFGGGGVPTGGFGGGAPVQITKGDG